MAEQFQVIAILDGLKIQDIQRSLNIEDNIQNIFKSGEGAGASGSFFFFSNDHSLIIKTLQGNEKKVLFNMI